MKTCTKVNCSFTQTPWFPLGLGAGIALGVAMNQLALWMVLGLVFGLAMNARFQKQ
jgi:hypothetical protein